MPTGATGHITSKFDLEHRFFARFEARNLIGDALADHFPRGVSRDRITGKADENRAVKRADGQGFSRFHGDFHHVNLASCRDELRDHVILFADRNPAGRDDDIRILGGLNQCETKLVGVVIYCPEIMQADGGAAQSGHHHEAVGVVNLSGGEAVTRLAKLASGAKKRDFDLAARADFGLADRGDGGDFARAKAGSRRQKHAALAGILAFAADIIAKRNGGGEGDGVARARYMFLHDDRIGPFGQGGAGENAECLAFADNARATGVVSGGNAACDPEAGRTAWRDVAVAQRVAIHAGIIKWRQRHGGDQILGQNAPISIVKINQIGFSHGLGQGDANFNRPIDRNEGCPGALVAATIRGGGGFFGHGRDSLI